MSNRYPGWDTLPGVDPDADPKPKKNKYGAVRTKYNGRTFDSAWEAEYAKQLDLRQRAGQVRNIQYQVRVPLVAARFDEGPAGTIEAFAVPIKYPSGRQAVHVIDFQYQEKRVVRWTATGDPFPEEWVDVFVDAKGFDHQAGRLRRAIVEAMLGIDIVLVKK